MNWISNYVRPTINSFFSRREVPDNLWTKCPSCSEMLFTKEYEDNLNVCPRCDHHDRIGAAVREAFGHRSFQLEIIVAADGKVVTITPRCEEILCPAADAYSAIVRTWEFAPGEYRNHPVPVRLRIEFELNPPSAPTESAPPPTPAQPARQ